MENGELLRTRRPAWISILNSQFSILNSQFSILNSQFSILNSISRLAFFQPITAMAAARYWTTPNAAAFVAVDLWLRDTHPVHFPVDVVPS